MTTAEPPGDGARAADVGDTGDTGDTAAAHGGGREYVLVLAVGAVAVGLVLLALGRPWANTEVVTDGMPRQAVAVSGAEASSWLRAVSLVALAALAATVATTGRWRQLLGAVLGLAAVAVAVGAATAREVLEGTVAETARETAAGADPGAVRAASTAATYNGWQWVTLLAAALLLAVGLAVVFRGRAWPGLSRRYQRSAPGGDPTHPAEPDQRSDTERDDTERDAEGQQRTDAQDLWRALDEGRDPTR